MGFLQRLLDEGGHDEVAPQLDVLAQVETLPRSTNTQLDGLGRLARQVTIKAPALADISAHGGIAMGLHTIRQIIKSGRVGDVAGDDASGKIRDLVCHAPPHAPLLLGRRVRRRRDRVPLDHQRVQVDHLHVVVQELDYDFPRDARRQRRYRRECGLLGHRHSYLCLMRQRDARAALLLLGRKGDDDVNDANIGY